MAQMTAEEWVDQVCAHYDNDYTKAKQYIEGTIERVKSLGRFEGTKQWYDDAMYWLACRTEMAWLD